jgi:hypothetical protein
MEASFLLGIEYPLIVEYHRSFSKYLLRAAVASVTITQLASLHHYLQVVISCATSSLALLSPRDCRSEEARLPAAIEHPDGD